MGRVSSAAAHLDLKGIPIIRGKLSTSKVVSTGSSLFTLLFRRLLNLIKPVSSGKDM
jgi:hypothetical protein